MALRPIPWPQQMSAYFSALTDRLLFLRRLSTSRYPSTRLRVIQKMDSPTVSISLYYPQPTKGIIIPAGQTP